MNKPLTIKFMGKKIHPDFTVTDDGIYCLEADVKSAVEWLKEKMDYESEESRNAYSENRNIDLGIAKRLITEAFPDLCPSGDLIADKPKSAKIDITKNIVVD